ncbi:hypothetical protein ACIBG8_45235 [Nonomuraea sp. NPDC050556]|uniref:hypothetical protein n=1 Tax=Nonomuraea sp. NPDC050556 TaxID=3364369 RepID=UPI0037A7E05D
MDYAGWNRAIAQRFFNEGASCVPVYLAVNDALLEELGGADDAVQREPATDFEAAVQTRVHGRDPFKEVVLAAHRWRKDGAHGDPPFIAVLAATVLAAARMDRRPDSDRGRFSYYRPLRQLLGIPGDGMPENYDTHVPQLWDLLKWWLDDFLKARRGLATAATHPATRHIGWSISQAVLTGADRTHVGLFLASLGASRDDNVHEADLLARFEEWLRLRGNCGKLEQVLANAQMRSILGRVLAQELKRFDGLVRDPSGRACLSLLLTSTDAGEPYGLAVRVPTQLRGVVLEIDGKELPIPEYVERMLLPAHLGNPVPGAVLELDGSVAKLLLPRTDCYVFQIDDVLGMWVTVDGAEAGLSHRVLVRETFAAEAEIVMRHAGGDAIRKIRRARIPSGWVAYSGYVPTRTVPAPVRLGPLVPHHRQLARLVGGLRLSPDRNIYLAGYAPDLLIPQGPEDGAIPAIALNGSQALSLPESTESTIRLADFAREPGAHEVAVDGCRLTFQLVDRLREITVAPTVRLAVRANGRLCPRPELVLPSTSQSTTSRSSGERASEAGPNLNRWACGAAVCASPSYLGTQLSASVTDRAFALGERGVGAELRPSTTPPGWLSDLGLPVLRMNIEELLAAMPFRPRWLLLIDQAGRSTAQTINVASNRSDGTLPSSWRMLSTAEWWQLADGDVTILDGATATWDRYLRGSDPHA